MFVHLLLDGFSDGSLGVALDILGTAAHFSRSGRVSVRLGKRDLVQRVVSIDGAPVRSSVGRTAPVDGALHLRALRPQDVVLVPGMFSASGRTLDDLLGREELRRAAVLLAKASAKGVVVAASCSAVFVLAASGLLDGRSATTSWWLASELARRFPEVSVSADRMVVDEGDVITAGAALAHADLTLAIVARTVGPSLPHLVSRYLVLDERPTQARYMLLDHLRANDPAVLALEAFVVRNLSRQISLEELARAAGVSSRTLARRVRASVGSSPQAFVQRVRIRSAVHLLETTRDSVDDIAERVGYADAAAFRRVFRRYAGESPRQLRERA
ncbi:GlxA family transcriptional regulator [Polyangium mundeleinium]|uniref:Helix-turn-helix domain-containing protein n=1 Tax=Polyangium mundeleinium TaxID=2995306 RepID=A0ABT5ES95_9BACT|nr:helix-turn-helix domain-containing protein [Polyangium mundeleinium]MDC0744692.1 helix-turn-helix domain-containing protein [Polyangium mundeleinium]